MRILEEWQSFIHTHFQTDGEQLPSERVREIERALLPTLRKLGIVFGFHLERRPKDPGIRVVLECRPAEKELQVIRHTLVETLRHIPRRPRPTVVRFASDRELASAGGEESHGAVEGGNAVAPARAEDPMVAFETSRTVPKRKERLHREHS